MFTNIICGDFDYFCSVKRMMGSRESTDQANEYQTMGSGKTSATPLKDSVWE